ncbi:MAG: DUF429 domain-containing protein [Vampirovibrio sp.]
MPKPMLSSLSARRHFLGIDLATGRQMANQTWLSHILERDGQWCLHSLASLKMQMTAKGLSTHPALKLFECLLQHADALIGIDASFGIPLALQPYKTWQAWLEDFPNINPTPEAFRLACQNASPLGKELKRQTDQEAKTPFSPYNLRHYRQTFTVLHDVLRPFVMAQKGSVLPMQAPLLHKPWVLESCPRSILNGLNLSVSPYKGKDASHQTAKAFILEALQDIFPVVVNAEQRDTLLTQAGGDALDSFMIAWHLCRQWQDNPEQFTTPLALPYTLEGYVY